MTDHQCGGDGSCGRRAFGVLKGGIRRALGVSEGDQKDDKRTEGKTRKRYPESRHALGTSFEEERRTSVAWGQIA